MLHLKQKQQSITQNPTWDITFYLYSNLFTALQHDVARNGEENYYKDASYYSEQGIPLTLEFLHVIIIEPVSDLVSEEHSLWKL